MTYPFSALVGQPLLKQALLLCAVNPGIGGVLIRGDKGTAKSTAVRGLSAVMPPVQRVAGSRFNCRPDEPLPVCDACQQVDYQTETIAVPFVDLPLGATEDRVVGSLDLESVLVDRQKKLLPGLLASAHQGILYIDEVNLLADHLVDVLLDVAAMGINTVQRDGLSVSHPARFMLIGTMNPEEGTLRPQFLDRFGLMVDVAAPRAVEERTEVVRRRIAFETAPIAFAEQWINEQRTLQQQIDQARQLLPSVRMADGMLTMISQLCTDLNIVSLRADIVLYKTALTIAALAGRTDVIPDDIKQAAELALPHRQRKKPTDAPPPATNQPNPATAPPKPPTETENGPDSTGSDSTPDDSPEGDTSQPPEPTQPEQVFGALPLIAAPTLPTALTEQVRQPQPAPAGKHPATTGQQRGAFVRAVPNPQPTDLAITATLQSALLRNTDDLIISRDDFHQTVRASKTARLILFVVDASGSMAAGQRMEAVKGAVLSLLTDAYQHRDSVGVISFRGVDAQLLLPPTRDVEQAEQALRALPTGGRTPLPHALQLALDVMQQFREHRPFLVVLSDGKANVSLPSLSAGADSGDAWQQVVQLAGQVRAQSVPALVLDTDADYLRLGRANALADALGADCISLDSLSADVLTETVSSRVLTL